MILISYIELKFQILSKFMIKLTHPNAEKKKKKINTSKNCHKSY